MQENLGEEAAGVGAIRAVGWTGRTLAGRWWEPWAGQREVREHWDNAPGNYDFKISAAAAAGAG
jgi:hypothetical protein